MKISEKLKNLPKDYIHNIHDLQGSLKDLSEKEYEKLKNSIEKYGFFVPFFVWIDKNGKKWTMDGHQRKRLIEKEYGNIQVPYQEVEAKNKQEAKEKILIVSSQYGKTTKEGFDEFAFDLETEFLKDFTTFEYFLDYENFELPEEINGDFENSQNPNNVYGGNSIPVRIGSLICYITDENISEKIIEITEEINNRTEDNSDGQKKKNLIGEYICSLIINKRDEILNL